MENPDDFLTLLGTRGYQQTPALVMTMTTDEANERQRRYLTSCTSYQNWNCRILNDSNTTYNTEQGTSDIKLKKVKPKIRGANKGIVVVTGHGNLQWMFGDLPGMEQPAIVKFATHIQELETSLNMRLLTIVLDSCWSAAELKEPIEGIANDSQARLLSKCLGAEYRVFGFNGKASEGIVQHTTSEGAKAKELYALNAVIFCNGEVVKGTIHAHPGSGVYHSTENINTSRPFYRRVFGEEKPTLYRTNSFSILPSHENDETQ